MQLLAIRIIKRRKIKNQRKCYEIIKQIILSGFKKLKKILIKKAKITSK